MKGFDFMKPMRYERNLMDTLFLRTEAVVYPQKRTNSCQFRRYKLCKTSGAHFDVFLWRHSAWSIGIDVKFKENPKKITKTKLQKQGNAII